MQILYIQIDNNSKPKGCGEDVEVLDCRCINDFCSLVGDALVGELKDENGKPLYRLINPIGKLLMEFKAVDEKAFNYIIEDWYDILGNLLHKGKQEDEITIKFPQQYVDWLLHNDTPYYEQVGKELQKSNGKILLSTEGIDDDIIASINHKVSHKLQEKKEDFSFAVFSNPIIQNHSNIVKRVCLEDFSSLFMKRVDWECQLKEKSEKPTPLLVKEKNFINVLHLDEKEMIFEVKGVSFKMIFIKGGTFTMGATYEQGSSVESRERPNHIVTLSDFFIGETMVTQELWTAVMDNNPSEYKGLKYPVQNVTWYKSQEFIHKLNSLTGHVFCLPTEAEWEFAARGGTKSNNTKYSGSNDINEVGWSNRRNAEGPHPVAQKKPNELGLYDMSGNLDEWCNDWYNKYESSSQKDPRGPSWGNRKVTRSGLWYTSNSVSRVTCRRKCDPLYNTAGFRLASKSDIIICDKEVSFEVENVKFKMIKVDGGTFKMGATSEQDYLDYKENEKPVHMVTISDYYIGQTVVTQALWESVMGYNPSKEKNPQNPIDSINWNDCSKFIDLLNNKTGRTFRLPTEAEWEFAARGGNLSKNYKYSGGDNIENVAWYKDNSENHLHPVGQKHPNELGLYDMSGNVLEWCQDWLGDYDKYGQTNPTGPISGCLRVLRGGDWKGSAEYTRVSSRGGLPDSCNVCRTGLRLVMQIK